MEIISGIIVLYALISSYFLYKALFLLKKEKDATRKASVSKIREDLANCEKPLRKLILEKVERIDLAKFYSAQSYPWSWNEKLARVLLLALEIGDVLKEEICGLLDKELKRNGRLCFEQHVKKETYPDHTFWPEALAYALQCGEFSNEEIKKIHFDHDQVVGTFIEQYGERDLLEKSFLRLLPRNE